MYALARRAAPPAALALLAALALAVVVQDGGAVGAEGNLVAFLYPDRASTGPGADPVAAQMLTQLGSGALLYPLGATRLEDAGQRLGAVGVLGALSIAVSPISWVHHLVFLVLPLSALVGAGRHRLAVAWAVVLIVSLPAVGTAGLRAGGPEPLWQLVVDAQGLTAVAAVLLLPRLLLGSPARAKALAVT